MKIFKVDFKGIYPVGNCLIIAANNQDEATEIASKTIAHTKEFTVRELVIEKPCVIAYVSGDY